MSSRFPTLLDAFNSAARFSNQMTGHYAAELREKNDQEARVRFEQISNDITDYARDHQYIGGENEDEDRTKVKEYYGEMERYIRDQYSKKFGRTDYHNQLIGKSLETARNHVLVEQDKWQTSRENNNFSKGIEKELELVKTGDKTPQQAMGNVDSYISIAGQQGTSFSKVRLDPQQRAEMREKASIETLKNFYAGELDKFNYATATPEGVTKFLESVKGKAKDAFAFMDTEEGSWNFKGKTELEDAFIQGKCFEIYTNIDAYFDKLVAAGEYGKAIELGKKWEPTLRKHFKATENEYKYLSNDGRNKASNYLNWKNIEGHLRQGKKGEDMLNIDFHWRDVFGAAIDGNEFILNGQRRTFADIEEGIHEALLIAKTAFLHENNNPLAHEEWQKIEAKKMKNFYDEFRDYLKDKKPDLLKQYDKFNAGETFFNKNSEYYHPDFIRDRGQAAISFYNNLLLVQGITDTAKLEEEMKIFTGKRLLDNVVKEKNVNTPAKRVIRDAELTRFLESPEADDIMHRVVNPEKDGIKGEGRSKSYGFRNEEQGEVINELAERQRLSAANMRDGNLDDLVVEWQEGTARKNDVQPRALLRSKSTGELFKIDYEGGKKNDEKEVLMKYNTSTKKWEKVPGKELQREKTQGEKNKAAMEKVQDNKKKMDDISKSLSDFKHPETGEYLDYKTTPPPNFTGKKNDWDPNAKHSYKMTDYQKIMVWTNYFLKKEEGK